MKTFIKNIIIFSIFQTLQFYVAVSEQIGIGIQQEELIIEKSSEYYLLFCDENYQSYLSSPNFPEVLILNDKFELIDTINIFNSRISTDYLLDFKFVKLIQNDLYYIISKDLTKSGNLSIINRKLNENIINEFKLPEDFSPYITHNEWSENLTIYFDNRYVIYINYSDKNIVISDMQSQEIITIIDDNDLRAIYYENGFLYYIKDNSIISYNIELGKKRILLKLSKKFEPFNSFIANENYVAVVFYESSGNLNEIGNYIEFYDLPNNKKASSNKMLKKPEYMKIVNDKLYFNLFIINQSFVFDLKTNVTTYLGEKVFNVGLDSVIDISNRSINLIDKNGNTEKKYLINKLDLPVNFTIRNNKLSFIKDNEIRKFYKGGLECIDLINNQRVINDIKDVNAYKLDDDYLYYIKENKFYRVGLKTKTEEQFYSDEFLQIKKLESFDFDENYFYFVGNNGKLYLLDKETRLIDSSFSELSNKYIKKIESYKNKLLILFSDVIDGVWLEFAYFDKNNLEINIPDFKEKAIKIGNKDISKIYTYDEKNDKVYFLAEYYDVNSIFVSDFKTIELLSFDFNKDNNVNSLQLHNDILLATSKDNVFMIDVNDYSVIKSEKYEIETLRNVLDYFEGHKNTIQNIVANDDYVIIVDRLYNIFKYDTQKLSVLIENFKDTECEDSIEVGYFDINGKEINARAINNKLLIVKYKCLENNKFFYKLEFRE